MTRAALVTGGAGFLGSALVRALVARGQRVRVFDDFSRGREENLASLGGRIEVVHGDVCRSEDLAPALEGMADIYHLAAINGTRHFYERPGDVLEVGLRGHLALLDAVRAVAGVERFVFASSSEVYQTPPRLPTPEAVPAVVPDPHNPRYSYACAKLAGEMLTLHALDGPRRVIVRPHNVYGPAMGWDHVIPELVAKIARASAAFTRERAAIRLEGDGRETRAFCYVDDAVRGILLAAERGEDGGIYNVGHDAETSIGQLAVRIGALLGVTVETRPGAPAPGGTPRRCPDLTRLRQLGYGPRVDLDEGLPPTLAWYREHLEGGRTPLGTREEEAA